MSDKKDFDVLVVGSGPGGQAAAITSAKNGKKIGIIERKPYLGGVSLQTGTIPSKALREVSFIVSRFSSGGMRELLTKGRHGHGDFLEEVISKKDAVVDCKESVVLNRLLKNGIAIIPGEAAFHDPHTIRVQSPNGRVEHLSAETIILATGSRPRRPAHIPFDKEFILDSTSLLKLTRLPESLIIVGGGVIASEFATIFAPLGVKVTIVDKHEQILGFLDDDVVKSLTGHMLGQGIELLMETSISKVERESDRVRLETKQGKSIYADKLLYAMGREPNYCRLDIEKAGLSDDDNGWVRVNEFCQTEDVGHIYIVGDLSGKLALASTAMEQGRIAACHACGCCTIKNPAPVPMAIYTVPEVACVGKTEKELKLEGLDYVVGRAAFSETARGQIIGERSGSLKLLAERSSGNLLGVHIVGELASELIHVGQTLMGTGASLESLSAQIFNYPTLAECYTLAANDALLALKIKS